jgi:TolB-like protein/Tfp pilus assembly protein PilF
VAHLLEYFLDHPGEVLSHDQLVEEVWDGRVVSDDAVRRAVSSLRHALPADVAQEWIKTIPRKGYLAQFPPAASTAPHQAPLPIPPLEPQAARPGEPAARKALPTRRFTLLLTLAALLLFALALWWRGVQHQAGSTDAAAQDDAYTLAVLPFNDLEEDAGSQVFADGLSEELLGVLARYSAFRVTARTSSFNFRGKERDARLIGEQLGVRYLVEGSVRRSGDQVRINAALIDTGTGFQLWSRSYDRTLADVFQLQRDIAGEVARALRVVLVRAGGSPARAGSPPRTGAYLEYLEGLGLMGTWGGTDAGAAIGHFQRAIELDPDFAVAYVELANAVMRQDSDSMEAIAIAQPLVSRAIELEPYLGEAYIARSFMHEPADHHASESDLRRGIALAPSYSPGYEALANELAQQNRFAEAFKSIDRAIALDPLRPRNLHLKAVLYFLQGNWDAAEDLELQVIKLEPRYHFAYGRLGLAHLFRGDFAAAVASIETAVEMSPSDPDLLDWLAGAYLAMDQEAVARQILHKGSALGGLLLAQYTGVYPPADWQSIHTEDDDELWVASDVALAGVMTGRSASEAAHWVTSRLAFDGTLATLPHVAGAQPAYLNMALILRLASGGDSTMPAIRQLLDGLPRPTASAPSPLTRRAACSRAVAAAVLGDGDQALAELSALFGSGRAPNWWWARAHPAFAGLRGKPRFKELLASSASHVSGQLRLLQAMRADGRVPDRGQLVLMDE